MDEDLSVEELREKLEELIEYYREDYADCVNQAYTDGYHAGYMEDKERLQKDLNKAINALQIALDVINPKEGEYPEEGTDLYFILTTLNQITGFGWLPGMYQNKVYNDG